LAALASIVPSAQGQQVFGYRFNEFVPSIASLGFSENPGACERFLKRAYKSAGIRCANREASEQRSFEQHDIKSGRAAPRPSGLPEGVRPSFLQRWQFPLVASTLWR
jgi:hypothetical protein